MPGCGAAVLVCRLSDGVLCLVPADDGLDELDLLLVLTLWPTIAAHAAQPPTNAKTAAPIIANVFNGDDFDPTLGEVSGALTSVHCCPSQYRCPDPPLGSGYQPGGGDGAAVMPAPQSTSRTTGTEFRLPRCRVC